MNQAEPADPGRRLAHAAEALLGCPFRLHGRDPATGIDCVGLVAAAIAAAGGAPFAPFGYGLRHLAIDPLLPLAARSGLTAASGAIREGDILLLGLGHGQHHLAIAVGEGRVIHAHAGLGRVVRQPRDPGWVIAAHWRLASLREG